jgi:hypothetical protein
MDYDFFQLQEKFEYFTNSEQTIYLISKNGELFEYSLFYKIFKKTKIKFQLENNGTLNYSPTISPIGGFLLFHSLSTLNVVHGTIYFF